MLNDLLHSKTFLETSAVKFVFVEAEIDNYIEDLAVVVHKVMDIVRPDVLFALIKIHSKVLCISRSETPLIDVGKILSRFDGGGHPTAASAKFDIPLKDIKTKLKDYLTKITKFSLRRFQVSDYPIRIIPKKHTVEMAYYTLNHLDLEYSPVGDKDGNLFGIVERTELCKAMRHGLSGHSVSECMTDRVPLAEESADSSKISDLMIASGFPFVILTKNGKVTGVAESCSEHKESHLKLHSECVKLKMRKNLSQSTIEILKSISETADKMKITAYCVGGMVRDILMNIRHKDIDIVVERDGIGFAKKLVKELGGVIYIHKKFNTAVIKLKNIEIDIATLRREYYEFPGALPEVAEGTLKQDLYRRDFTVNAMAISLNPEKDYGKLIDYSDGKSDIKKRNLSILYPLSFVEDPTRIYRAVRFEKRFNFTFSKDTIRQIKRTINMNIHTRITDRIKEEIFLIFNESTCDEIFLRLDEIGALRFIDTELRITSKIYSSLKNYLLLLSNLPDGDQSAIIQEKNSVMMMILFSGMGLKKGVDILRQYHFSEKLISHYTQGKKYTAKVIKVLRKELSDARIYKSLYFLSEPVLLYIICISNNRKIKNKIMLYLNVLKKVKITFDGNQLKEMGYTPGPIYSKIFFALKLAKLNKKINSNEEEKEYIFKNYTALLL